MRVPDRHLTELRERGYLVFEGFLGADELRAAQKALSLHYPTADEWLAFHSDLLDLAERFLGSADLRLYDAELWAKYAGTVRPERESRTMTAPGESPAR